MHDFFLPVTLWKESESLRKGQAVNAEDEREKECDICFFLTHALSKFICRCFIPPHLQPVPSLVPRYLGPGRGPDSDSDCACSDCLLLVFDLCPLSFLCLSDKHPGFDSQVNPLNMPEVCVRLVLLGVSTAEPLCWLCMRTRGVEPLH